MPAKINKNNNKKVNVQPVNIILKQAHRQSADIDYWKSALTNFESITSPNRVRFYDLIDDISLDGQIEATWGKRSDALVNTPLIFTRDGKQDEELNKFLSCPDMLLLLKDIHDAIAYGYSLIQIKDINYSDTDEQYHIDYSLINRKHVHPEPGFECVSIEQYLPTKDFLYKQPPLSDSMIWAGRPFDKGLLFKAAQYVIYKRGGFGDWAQFVECFGMPFREMVYDEYDEPTRLKLEQMLKEWGAFGYMLHPKGSELILHEASNPGQCPYPELIQECDASISKTILGNTLTTEQGSHGSQSLGSVHLQVEENKYRADKNFVLSVLNSKFKAILKRYGFNVTNGYIYFETPEKDWSKLQTKWQVIQGISYRVPVSDDFIYEEFDIPKPENYDELKKKLDSQPPVNPNENLSYQPSVIPGYDFFV